MLVDRERGCFEDRRRALGYAHNYSLTITSPLRVRTLPYYSYNITLIW